jgi:hypothetical protein
MVIHAQIAARVVGLAILIGTPQSATDTASIYRALARELAADKLVEKYVVSEWAVWGTDLSVIRPWLDSAAVALGAEVLMPGTFSLPPCPWGGPAEATVPVGYDLRLELPEFQGDSATVLVMFSCSNPDHYLQKPFQRDDRYVFRRSQRGWVFVRRRTERIT